MFSNVMAFALSSSLKLSNLRGVLDRIDCPHASSDHRTMSLILLNILAVLLESDGAILSVIGKAFFDYFEFISVTLFTVDYLARLYSAPANPLVGCRRGRVECLVYLLDSSLGGLADASIFRVFRIFRILEEQLLIAWRLQWCAHYSTEEASIDAVVSVVQW
ncbi:hypothetical protein FOL46_009829 [Perkinsus olseni]|uniref:Ion transport domain-containing protein n=1 Tax=Perkinsus olseni TaxID=32597 RepID=A0A7J6KYD2_PEROL|nr:hypothetical protein FOL46_009829 [Perkinsus olseni]